MNLLHIIIAGEGQPDRAVRRFKAEEAFRNIRKHPDDTLNQFKEKFDLAVDRLRLAGVQKPEEILAFAFLQKLDSTFNQLWIYQVRTGELLGAGIRDGRRSFCRCASRRDGIYKLIVVTAMVCHLLVEAQEAVARAAVEGPETREKTATPMPTERTSPRRRATARSNAITAGARDTGSPSAPARPTVISSVFAVVSWGITRINARRSR